MPKLTAEQQNSRRQRIVDAAEQCFARNGFHRTTMQDICREAGISSGALYVYFDSKEALIEALTERDRKQFLGHFAAAGDGEDFTAVMEHLFQVCIVDQPRHKSALCIEIGAESTRNPAIAATMGRFDESLRASLGLLLEDALAKGRIAPLTSIDQALTSMMVVADGVFWRRAVDPNFDAAAIAPIITAMMTSILRPLANPPVVLAEKPKSIAARHRKAMSESIP